MAPTPLRLGLPAVIRGTSAFICPNCRSFSSTASRRQLRLQQYAFKPRTKSQTPSRPSSRRFSRTAFQSTYYDLSQTRGLIRLTGAEVGRFLDGLLPAKILGSRDHPEALIYTAFLTAQGRISVDVFIYAPSSSRSGEEHQWYLECDRDSVPILFKHLKKHKLRTKFSLEKVEAEEARVVFADGIEEVPREEQQKNVLAAGQDGRPGMSGSRLIIANSALSNLDYITTLGPQGDPATYLTSRMRHGLAEGQSELTTEHSLPQESNIDLLGGIDFHKGCYLGQELTIRTHHTGVVRKRILPIQLYTSGHNFSAEQDVPEPTSDEQWSGANTPPAGANLNKVSTSARKGRSTGKFLGSVGNIGLALCRLEMMTDIQLTADATNWSPDEEYQVTWQDAETNEERSARVRPFVPGWVRQGIEANLRRKERRPPKRESMEDDDVD